MKKAACIVMSVLISLLFFVGVGAADAKESICEALDFMEAAVEENEYALTLDEIDVFFDNAMLIINTDADEETCEAIKKAIFDIECFECSEYVKTGLKSPLEALLSQLEEKNKSTLICEKQGAYGVYIFTGVSFEATYKCR